MYLNLNNINDFSRNTNKIPTIFKETKYLDPGDIYTKVTNLKCHIIIYDCRRNGIPDDSIQDNVHAMPSVD